MVYRDLREHLEARKCSLDEERRLLDARLCELQPLASRSALAREIRDVEARLIELELGQCIGRPARARNTAVCVIVTSAASMCAMVAFDWPPERIPHRGETELFVYDDGEYCNFRPAPGAVDLGALVIDPATGWIRAASTTRSVNHAPASARRTKPTANATSRNTSSEFTRRTR